MFRTYLVNLQRAFAVSGFLLITSCGGGGGANSNDQILANSQPVPQSESRVSIDVAGIKGPLAFANVELYALDTRFGELYQPGTPIAVATTNAYAQLNTGLPVPNNVAPPYVLVIDGTNATDLNTGQAPVIKKLVTVITQESLNAGRPIYATPYTTLAYQMLRLDQRGDGLQATYYNDVSFSNLAMRRVDPTVNFKWQKGSPAAAVNADRFSARWSGMVQPEQSGNYKFYTSTDDGVRLWVNNTLIVDHWTDQTETEYSGSINLAAGQKYSIMMEYFDNAGGAAAKLSWSGPNVPKTVIPKANLFSQAVSAVRVSDPFIGDAMSVYNQEIIQAVSFGMSPEANIFTTSPIITGSTTTVEQQQLVVHYRAAIEALSSLLYEMSLAASNVTSDAMLQKLALDLYNDGKVDGQPSGIDTKIIFRNPMTIDIANTQYLVQDIISLIDAERAITGNAGNVIFLKDSISVNLQSIDASSGAAPAQSTNNSVVTTTQPVNTSVGTSTGGGGDVLHADFEHLALGLYKESDLRSDFLVGKEGYKDSVHGPDWGSLNITDDPTNSGHGKVMRVLHRQGYSGASAKAGGFRFRADVPPADGYYFAYDYYVPADWWQPLQHKMPGLGSGTLLQMSHSTGDSTTVAELETFSYRIQSYLGPGTKDRGISALAAYAYDKDKTADPNWLDASGSPAQDPGTPYNIPNGRWITIEQYIHRGTPNNRDGILRIWINGQLMLDEKRTILRNSSGYDNTNAKVDGIFMLSYYGGSEVERNSPPNDQYQYYDNFTVSTSPITH